MTFGWLKARYQTFGNLPASTAQYLRDFGLAVFIASVGLSTSQALAQIKQYGITLSGHWRGCRPVCLPGDGVLRSIRLENEPDHLVRRHHGQPDVHRRFEQRDRCSRQQTRKFIGYTVSYAISNVLLIFLGPVLVFAI